MEDSVLPAAGDQPPRDQVESNLGLWDILIALALRWRLLLIAPLLAGAAAVGGSYLIKPRFTASTVLMPQQQSQGSMAATLASLGALVGAGGGASARNPADLYVALMKTMSVSTRIIDQFDLDRVYQTKFRFQTLKELATNVQLTTDRRSGLITITADDQDPQRAADMANAYVKELRRITTELAVTEAQQRRQFFESQLERARTDLTAAQQKLQASGFNESLLRTEPKAAAEAYANLQAQLTAAEVKLQTMGSYLANQSTELTQQQLLVSSLRGQLRRLETAAPKTESSEYVSKFRDFKYQEMLLELFARQYEAARVDESREGPLVQVVDQATVPEYKSFPKRTIFGVGAAAMTLMLLLIWIPTGHLLRSALRADPLLAAKFGRLARALTGREVH